MDATGLGNPLVEHLEELELPVEGVTLTAKGKDFNRREGIYPTPDVSHPGGTMEVELKAKGRVTLPAEIRKALALEPGDRLLLELGEGEVRLKPRRAVYARDVKGILKIRRVELEEIESALASE